MVEKSTDEGLDEVQMEIVNESDVCALRVQIGRDFSLLSPREVDEIIEALGFARAELEPSVPFEIERNHQFPLETRPVWKVIIDRNFVGAVVFFRHSGYGWTGFAIPYESLKKILALDLRPAFPVVSHSLN